MKLLVISDIHGDTDAIEKLGEQWKAADAVLFGGDFARFEHAETAQPVLDALCARHESVFAVLGNCDEPDFLQAIEAKDVSVQGTLTFFEGLAIAGSGGGSKFTGTTPFERTEAELTGDFSVVAETAAQNADAQGKWNNLILIMHNPPKNTACDMIPGGVHVGSEALRVFIEETSPLAVITGHIHESAGIDTIGTTTVINPGSLAEGKYAWLTVEKDAAGTWRVADAQLCQL